MRRIIIRHISGSKAEQVEEFPADQFKVLTLGRNPDQTIRFDPDKDDLVSRQHARITWETGQEERFFIAYALSWAEEAREEALLWDTSSPYRYLRIDEVDGKSFAIAGGATTRPAK